MAQMAQLTKDRTAPPPPRRARNRQATEEVLVDAACAAFAELGYEGTTTRIIAERAGCSEALIQRYFNGKEGLLLAVLRQDGDSEVEFMRRPLCATIAEEAREFLMHGMEIFAQRSHRFRIVLSRVLVDRSFKADFNRIFLYQDIKAEAVARFARYRELGMLSPDLDVEAVTQMLFSLSFEVGFLQSEILDARPAERRQLAEHFAVMFARGVSPRLDEGPPGRRSSA